MMVKKCDNNWSYLELLICRVATKWWLGLIFLILNIIILNVIIVLVFIDWEWIRIEYIIDSVWIRILLLLLRVIVVINKVSFYIRALVFVVLVIDE